MKAIILSLCFFTSQCPAQVGPARPTYQERLQEKCSPELLRFLTRVAAVLLNPHFSVEHRTERLKYVPTDELPEGHQQYFAEMLQIIEKNPEKGKEAEELLLPLSVKYPKAAEEIGNLQFIMHKVIEQHHLQEKLLENMTQFMEKAQAAGVKSIDEDSELMRSMQREAAQMTADVIRSRIEPAVFFDDYYKRAKVKIEIKPNEANTKGARPLIARPVQSNDARWVELECSPEILRQLQQRLQSATTPLTLEVEAIEVMREEGSLPAKEPISSTIPHEKHLLLVERLIE